MSNEINRSIHRNGCLGQECLAVMVEKLPSRVGRGDSPLFALNWDCY
jgi:hypothetical protein